MVRSLSDDISDFVLNFEILEDIYFSGKSKFGSVTVFRSEVFPDIGWNYSVLDEPGRPLANDEISFVKQNIDTETPIQVITQSQTKNLQLNSSIGKGGFEEYSVWMSITDNPVLHSNDIVLKVHEPISKDIINKAVDCFRDAYCNNNEASIGYHGLGPEYPVGFKKMLSYSKRAYLVSSYEKGELAGVASLVMHPKKPVAGLYNVAVTPRFRQRGHGAAVSQKATQLAFELGAKRCILQTEANSEVEYMYKKIGYNRDIMTYFYELQNA